MLGWMILFALMMLPGVTATMAGYPVTISIRTESILFALLLIAALLTRAIRGWGR